MIEYTKQDLYAAYKKHTRMGLDLAHVPGSDPDCAICDLIKQITIALGGEIEIDLPMQKKRERKTFIPKIYEVPLPDGGKGLYRLTMRKDEIKLLRRQDVREIPIEEYDALAIETAPGKVAGISVIEKQNQSGLIAKWGPYQQITGIAQRHARPDEYIYYDSNAEDVIAFAQPNKAFKTKKGNRIQIETSSGSVSVSEGEFLLKLTTGRLLKFSMTEFESLYEPLGDKGWITPTGENDDRGTTENG